MIVCAGFVSSGTRLLHTIVDYYMHKPALHRSYPHWDQFWDWRDFPDDTQWILIERDPEICFKSAVKAGHPGLPDTTLLHASEEQIRDWWIDWWQMRVTMPNPYIVPYGELVRDPRETIDRLASWLGVPTPLESYPIITDGNQKWL